MKYNRTKINLILDFYLSEVCLLKNIRTSELFKRSRRWECSDARAMVMYLVKKKFKKISHRGISEYFKLNQHSTVVYSIKKIENLRSIYSDVDKVLNHCERLDFVEEILERNDFVKIEKNVFQKTKMGKTLEIKIVRESDLSCELYFINCGFPDDKFFCIKEIDIFDAIIISNQINSDPCGTVIKFNL